MISFFSTIQRQTRSVQAFLALPTLIKYKTKIDIDRPCGKIFFYLLQLTAEGRLVRAVGTVGVVVAHRGEVDAQAVARTLPLPAGAAERRRRTVLLVTQVPAVIVTVADPAAQHAVAVVAAEEGRGAGARRACLVLVTAVLAVGMAVTLPVGRDAAAVRLALELGLVVAHARRPGGCEGNAGRSGCYRTVQVATEWLQQVQDTHGSRARPSGRCSRRRRRIGSRS